LFAFPIRPTVTLHGSIDTLDGQPQLCHTALDKPMLDESAEFPHAFPFHGLYAWQSRPQLPRGTGLIYAAQTTSSFVD